MGDKRIVRIKEGDAEGRHVVIVDDLVQSGGTLIECQVLYSYSTLKSINSILNSFVTDYELLCPLQKVLAAHGAAKISAYVTHGIFPKSSWKRFKLDTKGSNHYTKMLWFHLNRVIIKIFLCCVSLHVAGDPAEGFSYFWITDSCGLTVKEVMNKPPFEVLSLAGSIASALQV